MCAYLHVLQCLCPFVGRKTKTTNQVREELGLQPVFPARSVFGLSQAIECKFKYHIFSWALPGNEQVCTYTYFNVCVGAIQPRGEEQAGGGALQRDRKGYQKP